MRNDVRNNKKATIFSRNLNPAVYFSPKAKSKIIQILWSTNLQMLIFGQRPCFGIIHNLLQLRGGV